MSSIALFSITIFGISLLLAKKVKVGPTLLAASLLVIVLSEKFSLIPLIMWNFVTLPLFYWILAVITGVSLLGSLLKHLNKVPLLVDALESILKRKSLVVTGLPAIIGALPMPGGAYLSAPMVEKAGQNTALSEEKLTAINHWFRHLFEFFLPLYPGYILTIKLCKFKAPDFSLHAFPLAVIAAFIGFVVLLSNEKLPRIENYTPNPWKKLWSALWPITLVLLPSLAGIPFLISLYLAIAITAFTYKVSDKALWKTWFYKAFNLQTILMISGIFIFKGTIEATKLSYSLAPELSEAGLPIIMVLVLIPFLSGILTGIGVGFVGMCFPVLLPLITSGGIVNMDQAILIYASGWVGMMLSPAHLCLVLTGEYFESKMIIVYKYLTIMGIGLIAGALILTHLYSLYP